MKSRTYCALWGLIFFLYIALGLILFHAVEGWAASEPEPHLPMAAGVHDTVSVTLKEWHLIPEKASISHAGKVAFRVKNIGTVAHEMVILKTDLPAAALPVAAGKVKEEAAGRVLGEIEEFPPNMTEEIIIDLPAGHYVLFCNVLEPGQTEGHYQKGMWAAFTVGSPSK